MLRFNASSRLFRGESDAPIFYTLPNFNLSTESQRSNDPGNLGEVKMSTLQDLAMDRLCDLLAQGRLSNAQEIANLVKVELGDQVDLVPEYESSQSYFELIARLSNRQ
jgi:hypothetical protein